MYFCRQFTGQRTIGELLLIKFTDKKSRRPTSETPLEFRSYVPACTLQFWIITTPLIVSLIKFLATPKLILTPKLIPAPQLSILRISWVAQRNSVGIYCSNPTLYCNNHDYWVSRIYLTPLFFPPLIVRYFKPLGRAGGFRPLLTFCHPVTSRTTNVLKITLLLNSQPNQLLPSPTPTFYLVAPCLHLGHLFHWVRHEDWYIILFIKEKHGPWEITLFEKLSQLEAYQGISNSTCIIPSSSVLSPVLNNEMHLFVRISIPQCYACQPLRLFLSIQKSAIQLHPKQ